MSLDEHLSHKLCSLRPTLSTLQNQFLNLKVTYRLDLFLNFLYFLHQIKPQTFLPPGHILVFETKFTCGLLPMFSVNVPESWAENSNRIIQRSQNERSKSAQLRTDSDSLINQSANNIWNAWNATNSALSRRASEILEAKAKLQMHLHKVIKK